MDDGLSWKINNRAPAWEAQQGLHFLQILRKNQLTEDLQPPLLSLVASFSMICMFSNKNPLQSDGWRMFEKQSFFHISFVFQSVFNKYTIKSTAEGNSSLSTSSEQVPKKSVSSSCIFCPPPGIHVCTPSIITPEPS